MANTFNPYPSLNSEFTTGMTAIAGTTITTVDDLVNEIYSYVQSIYYPSSTGTVPRATELELKSVAYNIINAYNNKALGSTISYGPQQMNFVRMMLGLNTTNNTPIDALDSWFQDIEDNISKAGFSIDTQTPLLLGIEIERSVYAYWVSQVNSSTTPAWAAYFNANKAINWANIALWTQACTEGALIGANASQKGLIAPTTDIVSVNIVSTMIGALAIGAGKLIFKWVPRIQPSQLTGGAADAVSGCSCGNMPQKNKAINFHGA